MPKYFSRVALQNFTVFCALSLQQDEEERKKREAEAAARAEEEAEEEEEEEEEDEEDWGDDVREGVCVQGGGGVFKPPLSF